MVAFTVRYLALRLFQSLFWDGLLFAYSGAFFSNIRCVLPMTFLLIVLPSQSPNDLSSHCSPVPVSNTLLCPLGSQNLFVPPSCSMQSVAASHCLYFMPLFCHLPTYKKSSYWSLKKASTSWKHPSKTLTLSLIQGPPMPTSLSEGLSPNWTAYYVPISASYHFSGAFSSPYTHSFHTHKTVNLIDNLPIQTSKDPVLPPPHVTLMVSSFIQNPNKC